jgi:hypothetical protein
MGDSKTIHEIEAAHIAAPIERKKSDVPPGLSLAPAMRLASNAAGRWRRYIP